MKFGELETSAGVAIIAIIATATVINTAVRSIVYWRAIRAAEKNGVGVELS